VLEEVVAKALVGVPADIVTVGVPYDLPLVRADAGLLERVIANLVDNARRFAPAGVPVRVESSYDENAVRVHVVDTGPGVPEEDRERIFTPFQRLGDNRSDGGAGLGLAIARGFAEAMAGTVLPSETPGGGLTMTVTLPVVP
jgi:signal transduction histidine kinase